MYVRFMFFFLILTIDVELLINWILYSCFENYCAKIRTCSKFSPDISLIEKIFSILHYINSLVAKTTRDKNRSFISEEKEFT